MRRFVAVALVALVALALAGCSGDAEKPEADDKAAVAPRQVVIPDDADGVVQSVNARAGTAVVTDWEGVDHIVPDAGLEDATYVVLDDRVAYPVETKGGTSAGKVAPLEGAAAGSVEQGVAKWFNDARGYGFIVRERGVDVFVQAASLVSEGFQTLAEGDRVKFQVIDGPKGPQAVAVVKIS